MRQVLPVHRDFRAQPGRPGQPGPKGLRARQAQQVLLVLRDRRVPLVLLDHKARQDHRVPLARLEPYGLLILIGALILLPLLGAQLGLNLDVISTILRTLTGYVLGAVLFLTGNT